MKPPSWPCRLNARSRAGVAEDERGQRAVQPHRDAGEGAGLLADLEGAGGADAVRGDADREAAGGIVADARAFISGVTITEPRMPVRTTSTAASAGMPPRSAVSAMAIGAVTDFAASEARISRGAPSAQAIADRRADRGQRAGDRVRRASAGGCAAPRSGCARAAGRARRWRGRAGSARTARRRNRSGSWCRWRSAGHDQQAGRDHHRAHQRVAAEAGGDAVADRESHERRGEPEQRAPERKTQSRAGAAGGAGSCAAPRTRRATARKV